MVVFEDWCISVCVCVRGSYSGIKMELLLLKLGILCSFLDFLRDVDIRIYTVFENLGFVAEILIYFKLSKVIKDSSFDKKVFW